VVQEYERAVIFRLGRLLKGGARGPGIFFIVPCIDTYRKIDLRTVSFDVPPQEVSTRFQPFVFFFFWYILFKNMRFTDHFHHPWRRLREFSSSPLKF
jgi:regulator of protease activity HflC (stomatin/prohibitin superfamily)